MEITVQLDRWINALIGTKEFAVLDEAEAQAIRNVVGHDTLCTIEEACNKLFILKHYRHNPEAAIIQKRRLLVEEFITKAVAKYGEEMRYILEQQSAKMNDEQINKRMAQL